jgi:hypothetical protein
MDESQVASKVGRLLAIVGAKLGSSKSRRQKNSILILFIYLFRSQQGSWSLLALILVRLCV